MIHSHTPFLLTGNGSRYESLAGRFHSGVIFLMRKIALFVSFLHSFPANAQTSYWQQEVNYQIEVSLNDSLNTLDGKIKIDYINHSPDTLSFIWIHLWPNAYKNDQTAFSDQLLENGKTSFYFSDKNQRGYINRLEFRVDGIISRSEDHPQYIDIIKLILDKPLAPGQKISITTAFHEQIPFNFSRGGHVGESYQITQWYPKPAVYDSKGWHPMPYLDQGEYFSEFGNYDVTILVPKSYQVAATGQRISSHQDSIQTAAAPVNGTQYLRYAQGHIHDFAWFADKQYREDHDTVQLPSGKIVDCYAYYVDLGKKSGSWKKAISFIKKAVIDHSRWIGEYPYSVVKLVEAQMGTAGGMEYPTITSISPTSDEKELEETIFHEVGHNWFCEALATNERRYPWMDEGMNSYYDNRNKDWCYDDLFPKKGLFKKKLPEDPYQAVISTIENIKLDQPISTSSEDFSVVNYALIAYEKAARWMKQLEDSLGTSLFDKCMQEYYQRWKFKHPYPQDFKAVIEEFSGKSLDELFASLDKTGPLRSNPYRRKIKPTLLFSARDIDHYDYMNFFPAIGYNVYDQFMVGAIIHNYNLAPANFRYVLAPLYASGSNQWVGLADLSYTGYPARQFQNIRIGLSGARFSSYLGTDSNGSKIFGGFYKVVPSIRLRFRNESIRSTKDNWIEFKTYFIGEKGFSYFQKSTDSLFYPSPQLYTHRYLNQLTWNLADYRVLYPYDMQIQAQQASDFYRLQATANYFFNYPNGGGVNLRLFAAKFGFIGERTEEKEFETSAYQPKLTAVRGSEDYTYGNYFLGRHEEDGFASQQIMMRDGGLKLRTDLFQGLQGKSENWIASINLNSSLPKKLFPIEIPLKIFLDLGTYAEAWGDNPPTSRFLFVGGLQLSLIKDLLNIYFPLFYSADFSNSLKTVPEENTFWKKISFSMDIQHLNAKKLIPNFP
ncbi:MAG: M1 family metallopeptidase [Chitinophagales bacterium]